MVSLGEGDNGNVTVVLQIDDERVIRGPHPQGLQRDAREVGHLAGALLDAQANTKAETIHFKLATLVGV